MLELVQTQGQGRGPEPEWATPTPCLSCPLHVGPCPAAETIAVGRHHLPFLSKQPGARLRQDCLLNCLSLCLSTGRCVLRHHPAPSGRRHFWIQCDRVCLRPLRYCQGQHPEEGMGQAAADSPAARSTSYPAPAALCPSALSSSSPRRQVDWVPSHGASPRSQPLPGCTAGGAE